MAFVAAALALGICLGVDFDRNYKDGDRLDLSSIIRTLSADAIPEDVRDECLKSIEEVDRPKRGDWFAIWGGENMS